MSAEKKKSNPKFTTPRGLLKYPRLNEPDTKFKDAGEYSTKLVLSKDAAKDLIDKLAPLHKEAAAEGKKKYAALETAPRKKLDAKGGYTVNPLFTPVYDDQEKETGEVEFSFKLTASGVSKKDGKPWTRRPALFDAGAKPLKNVSVWGGSEGKVNFEVRPYFIAGTGAAGLTLSLIAVQVLKLVGPGERSAESCGFEAEEGFDGSATEGEGEAPAAKAEGDKDASTDF